MYYPWQQAQWQQVIAARHAGRLPHALLLCGAAGMGKAFFAENLVKALLCTGNDKNACCGECHACRLIAGRVHPNVFWLEPEKLGAAIKVDQIRAVSEFVVQSSLKGEMRFVVINPADDMNINAANALLKTLEEPADGAMLILLSNEARALPATILSRCQRIIFSRPDKNVALAWIAQQEKLDDPELLLRLSNGAPLAALSLAKDAATLKRRSVLFKTLLNMKKSDPLRAAAANLDYDLILFMDHFISWLKDLVQLGLNIDAEELTNYDYRKQLANLKSNISIEEGSQLLHYMQNLRNQISRGFNLNKQLTMESIFMRWSACMPEVICS